MKKASVDEIVKLAASYCKSNVPWHHHFLNLKCKFNRGRQFNIILENENTEESFVSEFEHRPMKELELLENLFFRRKRQYNRTPGHFHSSHRNG